MTTVPLSEARIGDVVEIVGHRVGDAPRSGQIVEVLGGPDEAHFRIRWEDDRETLLYPGADIVVSRSKART